MQIKECGRKQLEIKSSALERENKRSVKQERSNPERKSNNKTNTIVVLTYKDLCSFTPQIVPNSSVHTSYGCKTDFDTTYTGKKICYDNNSKTLYTHAARQYGTDNTESLITANTMDSSKTAYQRP